jgi:hypothetical protein
MPELLASFVCRRTDSVGMEDQETPMSEGYCARKVLGAGDQPKRDAFHTRLSAWLLFI